MEYKFLGNVNNPQDLKKLNNDELNVLCSEIRDKIMNTVSLNGGHLASNLGTVELTLAIHKNFNSPDDSIIFDVGHQSYTHKLITGRYDRFDTLRQKGGISGFMRPDESEHDPFITGHSSNSISAACGIAKANSLAKNGNFVIAVIGDGALTGGMAFEGLNNAVQNRDKLIIIINDNKMSISKNVGALAKSLNKVRTSPSYYSFKDVFEKVLCRIPIIGRKLRNAIYNSKLMLKNAIYHNNVFEGLGFDHLGPVDGHDIEKVSKVLQIAKASKHPTVIHVLTVKGKGYKFAEAKPNSYHGVAPFDVEVGLDANAKTSFSDEFGNSLTNLAKEDEKICAITAAMAEGTGLVSFSKAFPNRFFDVGISEQHAVAFAAGLAAKCYKPFFVVYSSFLQRAVDQVFHDAAIANLPVTICVDRAGLVGNDGETHQGVYDISLLSAIPNVSIFSPSNYSELDSILKRAAKRDKGVWIIRYPRGAQLEGTEDIVTTEKEYDVVSHKSSRVCVVSYGITLGLCYSALKDENCDLYKLNLISNISEELVNAVSGYDKIYFFEETAQRGGIAELLSLKLVSRGFKGEFKSFAIDNNFVSQATQTQQRELYSLDAKAIHKIITGG